MPIPLDAILRPCCGVVSRGLEDARIALRLDRTETLIFNATANGLWPLFDGVRTVAAVAAVSGVASAVVAAFAAELVALELFEIAPGPAAVAKPGAAAASAKWSATEAPRLLAREELAVMGGCTSSTVACSTPGSSIGGGQGQGNPPGPPTPPPGLNK